MTGEDKAKGGVPYTAGQPDVEPAKDTRADMLCMLSKGLAFKCELPIDRDQPHGRGKVG